MKLNYQVDAQGVIKSIWLFYLIIINKFKQMKNLSPALVALVLLSACNNSLKQTEVKKDKNVLFVVIDDLNTTVGCYGHPVVKTPNIDALAQKGIKFTQAHCNFAVCGPSRGSFLAGVRPENLGVTDNRTPLQDVLGDRVTLPYLFKQNGYHTASVGKIFHGNERGHGDDKAWDEIYKFDDTDVGKTGEMRNMTDGKIKWCYWQMREGTDLDQQDGQHAQKAIEIINAKRDKPFFLALGFSKPHDPFVAPKKYFDMYPLEDCNPAELPENWVPVYPHSFHGDAHKTFMQFTEQDKREFLRSYYACTSFMDAQFGKVMTALEESGQLDNTLIVFFGDHGYHLGEHEWWNKVTVYEKGTNAPFIIAGNATGKKGVDCNAMFEFVDIYPTLADLFNLEFPAHLEGKSFKSIIKNPSLSFRKEIRAITRRGDYFGTMIKNKDWRYIEWDNGKKGRELYDQHNDPIEYHNLAENPEYTEVVAEMKDLLNKDE
ncbi:sulfatase [Marinilabilia sp.]